MAVVVAVEGASSIPSSCELASDALEETRASNQDTTVIQGILPFCFNTEATSSGELNCISGTLNLAPGLGFWMTHLSMSLKVNIYVIKSIGDTLCLFVQDRSDSHYVQFVLLRNRNHVCPTPQSIVIHSSYCHILERELFRLPQPPNALLGTYTHIQSSVVHGLNRRVLSPALSARSNLRRTTSRTLDRC